MYDPRGHTFCVLTTTDFTTTTFLEVPDRKDTWDVGLRTVGYFVLSF